MIDVTRVNVDEKAKEVLITGVDLDSLWFFSDEPDETEECREVTYKFDVSLAGTRKYLYLVTKNNKTASEYKYMQQRLEALVGQTIYLSDNFRVKDEV